MDQFGWHVAAGLATVLSLTLCGWYQSRRRVVWLRQEQCDHPQHQECRQQLLFWQHRCAVLETSLTRCRQAASRHLTQLRQDTSRLAKAEELEQLLQHAYPPPLPPAASGPSAAASWHGLLEPLARAVISTE